MITRTIYWIEETQEWHTVGQNSKIVNPMIGDIIDILASDRMWIAALKRRNLTMLPIYGTDEFVQVVALQTVNKQSKISLKGFQSRKKRRY